MLSYLDRISEPDSREDNSVCAGRGFALNTALRPLALRLGSSAANMPFRFTFGELLWRGHRGRGACSLGKDSFLSLAPHYWIIIVRRGSQIFVLCTSC